MATRLKPRPPLSPPMRAALKATATPPDAVQGPPGGLQSETLIIQRRAERDVEQLTRREKLRVDAIMAACAKLEQLMYALRQGDKRLDEMQERLGDAFGEITIRWSDAHADDPSLPW